MLVLVLVAVIALIVYSARKARGEHTVRIGADHPNRVLECNVRDMSARLVQLNPLQTLETHALRRDDTGTWEQALELDGETPEEPRWVRCKADLESTLERAYCRYNRMADPDAG